MSIPNRNDDILELRNIHKSYDGLAVLRGVSLSAKPGTVTSIIGSSGSGKSTLMRMKKPLNHVKLVLCLLSNSLKMVKSWMKLKGQTLLR